MTRTLQRLPIIFLAVIASLLLVNSSDRQYTAAQTATETPTAEVSAIPLYGLFETQFDLTVSVSNPYDPNQIDVTAHFTAPNGSQISIPAFWMQQFSQTCIKSCLTETLQPTARPGWRVRFTPTQIGDWTYIVQTRDATTTKTVLHGQFTVVPSKRAGFISVGQNRHYFEYANKTPYFPVGTNLGWSWNGQNGTLGYLNWLQKLHDVGANYARLYIDVPWYISLDWHTPVGNYTAAQEDGWRLDAILQAAEEQGIALQLVLVWYQGFSVYNGPPLILPTSPARPNMEADWSKNPYNAQFGGPLNSPASFFGSEPARELFKRRLRYIAARWGYSTSVFAWEIIDQLDRITMPPEIASDWLNTSVTYLRTIDPYGHLVTAGVRDSAKANLLDPVVLDFKQTRFYQRRPIEASVDQVVGTMNVVGAALQNADRPILLTEFSLGQWFEPTADDPDGIHVRETMWATALSGTAGSAASWWWDTYLFPRNLTTMFAPLAAFTKGIPWNTASFQPEDLSIMSRESVSYQPYKVTGFNGTFNTPPGPDVIYRVTPDGVIPPISSASSFIYGLTYNAQFSRSQKYLIAPPIDTKLTITIHRTSEKANARLAIQIDDKLAAEMTLSPSSANIALSVPISAGQHTVRLDNSGEDYFQIESIEIAAYITPLRTMALVDRKAGIFLAWLQHREYTWENASKNLAIQPVTARLRVSGMPPGIYQVELWDPFSGNVLGQENISVATDGTLTVDLLPISKMLAVRAIRISDAVATAAPTAAVGK